ncbi:hypothetical protein PPTG_22248 [Phytophthora nicotianae INRA-310]|uniref:Uncharacterized protein n=1 Tax=Phytophthora nicotianae (strain INRA-310) TaxID=761204 RepID=W2QLA7_PHYN3|nr:hypothetical protein PPTG_22248 [Phytophthora nicotianae INRA-310]ETN13701.1 hypothetical protein PPTG_22248 [Phytophthora nicotianae INRA-310]
MIDSLRQARIRFVIKIDVQRQVLNKIDGRVLCKIDVQTRALGEIVGWSQRHIGLVIKIVEQSQHKHSRSEELKQADGTEGGHVLDAISAPHELGDEECVSAKGATSMQKTLTITWQSFPDLAEPTEEAKNEDIQVRDSDYNTTEAIDKLRRIIWRRHHLQIGKDNALPPAAAGVVCDIDVRNTKPVPEYSPHSSARSCSW